jgi:glycosyltransferase involved in cell wall biosynthesis
MSVSRRILLLITDLGIGGTPTVVRELATRLHDPPRVNMHAACLAPWGPVADQILEAGIEVTALDARGPRDWATVGRLIHLIRARRFDTVCSFLIHANTAAAAASVFCPNVCFIQSIQTTQPEPRWHWQVQRLIQAAARRIVVPSPSVAQAAARWSGVARRKLAVIPNAIDPAAFAASPVPEQNPRPYPIGFIGRLDPIKRIPLLLKAVAILRDLVHLHIYGDGRQRDAIRSEIERLGLREIVTLHRATDRPQSALSRIGLLVLPSQAEGFGLVLIEAMAAAVPVIAMNVPGVRDVVRHDHDGWLIDSDEPADLARAVRSLVIDAQKRRELIRGGRETVRSRFAWDRVLPAYRELFAMP